MTKVSCGGLLSCRLSASRKPPEAAVTAPEAASVAAADVGGFIALTTGERERLQRQSSRNRRKLLLIRFGILIYSAIILARVWDTNLSIQARLSYCRVARVCSGSSFPPTSWVSRQWPTSTRLLSFPVRLSNGNRQKVRPVADGHYTRPWRPSENLLAGDSYPG